MFDNLFCFIFICTKCLIMSQLYELYTVISLLTSSLFHRSEDDWSGSREGSLTPQSLSQDKSGGWDWESWKYSEQVVHNLLATALLNTGQQENLTVLFDLFPGSLLFVMTLRQNCREWLLLTIMEQVPKNLFRGMEPYQGKTEKKNLIMIN